MDAIDKSDIEESFKGKLWTYTPACRAECKIGVAVANEPGFTPIPHNMTRDCGDRYNEQKAYCDALNTERGQTKKESLEIVSSSIAADYRRRA